MNIDNAIIRLFEIKKMLPLELPQILYAEGYDFFSKTYNALLVERKTTKKDVIEIFENNFNVAESEPFYMTIVDILYEVAYKQVAKNTCMNILISSTTVYEKTLTHLFLQMHSKKSLYKFPSLKYIDDIIKTSESYGFTNYRSIGYALDELTKKPL